MAKRFTVLVATLAMLLAVAAPALAQQGSLTLPVGATGDTRTVNFELAMEGTPPADATFFGLTVEYLGPQLIDPDGNGVYTGSLTLATRNFPPSERLPLMIVQGTGTSLSASGTRPGAPMYTIKDFGLVMFEDGDTLSASVSFPENGRSNGGSSGNGGSDTSDGSGKGNSGSSGSSADNGSDAAGEAGGESSGGPGGISALPATGGAPLAMLGSGILLIAGGLLARGIVR